MEQRREELFLQIKEHYERLDKEGMRRGKLPMHDTDFGFWGTSNMQDVYDFFERIDLSRFKHFADLGCGDGRVVLIASLFTKATGVEGDAALVATGRAALEKLRLTTMGCSAELRHNNYYDEDFSPFDIIFMFPDKKYDAFITKKLLEEFTGYLFVYNKIHDLGVPAGKTYWIEQMPIKSFPVNVPDTNLELHE